MDDVCSYERKITETAESAFRELWGYLGLEVEERDDREWALWVNEPTREALTTR